MGFGWEFDAFFALLALNAVIALLCRLAAPHRWAQRLCFSALIINGFILLIPPATGLYYRSAIVVAVMFLPWVLMALEFLLLLHGVIDSPDIPLNVSRSFLQSDSNVKKINSYISRKVAEKLAELFKKDRKSYEEKWSDIGLFVKYGALSDEKFWEKAKEFILLDNTSKEHYTLEEYQVKVKDFQTDKNGQLVYLYTADAEHQHSYVAAAQKKGYDVLLMNSPIDTHFIHHLEMKLEKTSLKRVDADTADKLIEKEDAVKHPLTEEETGRLKAIFDKALNNMNMKVEIESLPADALPVTITMEEWMRRMKDMSRLGGGGMNFYGSMPDNYKVAVNANHAVISKLLSADESQQTGMARQLTDLALLAQGLLKGADLTAFVERSIDRLG